MLVLFPGDNITMKTLIHLIGATILKLGHPYIGATILKLGHNDDDIYTHYCMHKHMHMYIHTHFTSMDSPGSNTRRSAASLSLLEKEMKKKTVHVILVPLLSADPNTFSVLI